VGLTKEKSLLEEYEPQHSLNTQRAASFHNHTDWDGISIILHGIVCVDIDTDDMIITKELPYTWTEKTKRGWHLFYRLPKEDKRYACIVGYQPNLDLLVKNKSLQNVYRRNGQTTPDTTWYGHALVSPSDGYSRVLPEEMMPKKKLPIAPGWILRALSV
jgi:hypothetical protein